MGNSSSGLTSENELSLILEHLILQNQKEINNQIKNFADSKQNYRNITLNPDLQLILRSTTKAEITMNIGFPFPIYANAIGNSKIDPIKGVNAAIHLRGSILRDHQRLELVQVLHGSNKTTVMQISGVDEFRKICKESVGKYKSFVYVDPYTFIGDSFIGLHFADAFCTEFGLGIEKVYSKSYTHLKFAYKAEDYDSVLLSGKMILIPDLLDSHWKKTIQTINSSAVSESTFFVVGRNLIIKKSKSGIQIIHLRCEDPLLKKSNIEDYMNGCLHPYLNLDKQKKLKQRNLERGFNIIINPFGSEEIKTLPKSLVLGVIKGALSMGIGNKVRLISYHKVDKYRKYIDEMKRNLRRMKIDGSVLINEYASFTDMARDIEKSGVNLGLTADSSLAHFFNAIGLPNITLYNSLRWDGQSMQSLASDSPLGFCRYNYLHFPAVFNSNQKKDISKPVLEYLKLIHKKQITKNTVDINTVNANMYIDEYAAMSKKCDVDVTLSLFNPKEILGSVRKTEGSDELMISALKISPLYKYGCM